MASAQTQNYWNDICIHSHVVVFYFGGVFPVHVYTVWVCAFGKVMDKVMLEQVVLKTEAKVSL